MSLDKDEKTLYKSLDKKTRYDIRKSIQSNLALSSKIEYSYCEKYIFNNLPPLIKANIRQREYEKKNSDYKQRVGNIDQVLEDSGLQETLNMAK